MTAAAGPAPSRLVADVGGVAMSALLAEAPRPRAVVVALHGGATTSVYFDAPNRPRLSLVRTGAALGFTVLALDRPGYGASAARADRMATAGERVDLAYAAVDRLLASRPRGAGVVLVGHSLGCELAVRMAADERGRDLLGLEISGTGRHYRPSAARILTGRFRDGASPASRAGAVRDLVWGGDALYPERIASEAGVLVPGPPHEGGVARSWPHDFPAVAARVRVPVHYTLAEHEGVWRSGPAGLADVTAMFTAAPRVAGEEQAGGGHNLSLGLSARAYHLRVLAFAEECVLARERADRERPSQRAPVPREETPS
ncbi:alpha/beta hydrolase [Actinomadura opuntiae]|uniref:alpha/beta hydrolase n=1 Tax=Actinomadura sp. OS1-43 TaxID=604315 RepID=UPI00255AC955|nr:alpha/beta fold hydrolase [Actinomadura sp. OS1-43]MDL4816380.1 alpha/beta fold hydrolase [Actinomadura sp. OS1-43]